MQKPIVPLLRPGPSFSLLTDMCVDVARASPGWRELESPSFFYLGALLIGIQCITIGYAMFLRLEPKSTVTGTVDN
jgi:hypothetical protein